MASPGESKVDENEVTSEPHHRHHRQRDPTHGGDDRGRDLDLAFPLIRQSSIYSLTLDEIQNTVCEPGKSFGSMNMDEFLNNIWSVEEAGFGAAPDSTAPSTAPPNGTRGSPPLQRQGSLTVPLPLCRKTVDEVWAEIHHEQEVLHSLGRAHHGGGGNAHRQPTFGEMTLEDFLIKAGVVREGLGPASPRPPPSSAVPMQFEVPTTSYPIATGAEGAGFGHVVGPAGYEYHAHHRPAASEGHLKRYGNGYAMQQVPVGSPVSPVSSDGLGGGQADNSGYAGGGGGGGGLEGNGAVKMNGGRKRAGDGPVEKVVERRQRRMIKNRESAARSRARKQAYTVELETELNMLKEENSRLREEERRARALRKQMIVECMAEHAQANAEKAAHSLRRCNSGPP